VPSTPLRYALVAPVMRFPALAALAGRAPLGEGREVVIAAFVAARLTVTALPPAPMPAAMRAQRAAAARGWLAAIAMPTTTRTPLARLIDASGRDDMDALRAALRQAVDAMQRVLNAAARRELDALAGLISGP
jgi:hypothetical protein